MRTQALEYRSNFNKVKAEASIKEFNKNEQKKIDNIEYQLEVEAQIANTTIDVISKIENELFDLLPIPENLVYSLSSTVSGLKYNFVLSHFESINDTCHLYEVLRSKVNEDKSGRSMEVEIKINLKHKVFIQNESLRNDHSKFFMLINFIRCLAYSECVSKDSGARDVFIFRNSINQFINLFLNE